MRKFTCPLGRKCCFIDTNINKNNECERNVRFWFPRNDTFLISPLLQLVQELAKHGNLIFMVMLQVIFHSHE